MSFLRGLRAGLLVLAAALSLPCAGVRPAAPARAAEGPEASRWRAQADTVFRHLIAPEMRYADDLAQDAQGFIWVGTGGGLTRWDGYRTRTYQADADDAAALPDSRIRALHTDRRGRLWAGTAVGGLVRYDPARDGFDLIAAGRGGLSDPAVLEIADAGATGLWIVTGAGLDHLDLASGVLRPASPANAQLGAIKAVLQDRDGRVWLGTERGLFRRAAAGADFVAMALPKAASRAASKTQVAPARGVDRLVEDSTGRIWVASPRGGVFVFEPDGASVRELRESDPRSQLADESVRAIVELGDGRLWLSIPGSGILEVDPAAGWQTRRIRHDPRLTTSLQDDDVGAMLRDRSGLVWVSGTMALNVHDPTQVGISSLFGADAGDKPIQGLQVPAVYASPDGRVWLSNGNVGGIAILDPARGRVGELRPDPSHPLTALPRGRVLAMARAPTGDVFIGTAHGLYRADARGRHVARVDFQGRHGDAAVFALCIDEERLWIGGEDGLWSLELRPDARPLLLRHDSAVAVGGERVSAILRGTGRQLWIGTSIGLARLALDTGILQRLPTDLHDPTALLAGYVSSLLIDSRGRLWVATIGSGLQVIERQEAGGRLHVRRLGTRQGLPHNGVDMLLADDAGQVWASTDKGLAQIDPATLQVRALGEAQGVAIGEFWSNSGARTAEGDLIFGGQGGLVVVRPRQLAARPAAPAVVVTEARSGGRTLVASQFNADAGAARWEIPAKENSLTVEFAALDLSAPELNRYSYRLQGFDERWSETSPGRRLASYTNLPPGDYVLQLRGTGHEAPWPATTLEIPVRVLPAWYQTAWFRAVAALAAACGLACVVQLRTEFLRRRQRELEGLVALRTAELEASTAELRASQSELEKLAYFDPLTGLANRRRFNEDLHHALALAQRGIGHATLLLVDLDKFKQLNDTLGHDAGDAVLVEVARRLAACVRQVDRVARLGGDEFAVLLAESPGAVHPDVACERVVTHLSRSFHWRGHRLRLSASVGAARCPDPADPAAQASEASVLYKRADLALYEVKRNGGSGWRAYDPSLAVAEAAVDPAAREPST